MRRFYLKPGSQMVVHHLFKSFEFLRVVSTSLESIWVKTIIFLSIETFNDGWKNVAETRLLFIREAELHTDLFSSGSWLAGLHRLPNFVRRWLHHRTDPIRECPLQLILVKFIFVNHWLLNSYLIFNLACHFPLKYVSICHEPGFIWYCLPFRAKSSSTTFSVAVWFNVSKGLAEKVINFVKWRLPRNTTNGLRLTDGQ